jgi:hypothetical protein
MMPRGLNIQLGALPIQNRKVFAILGGVTLGLRRSFTLSASILIICEPLTDTAACGSLRTRTGPSLAVVVRLKSLVRQP